MSNRKRNAFGEAILGKDYDTLAVWVEEFGMDEEQAEKATLTADNIDTSDSLGWNCSIRDDYNNSLEAQDFETREQLLSWLVNHNVVLVDL